MILAHNAQININHLLVHFQEITSMTIIMKIAGPLLLAFIALDPLESHITLTITITIMVIDLHRGHKDQVLTDDQIDLDQIQTGHLSKNP